MNICLINPPRLIQLMSLAHRPSLPLGLAYIAGALRDAGHRVEVIDSMALAPDQYVRYDGDILAHGLSSAQITDRILPETDIVGIAMMFSGNWPLYAELANHVKAHYPNMTIMAGGEHVTAIPELCFRQCDGLDVCVMGEGEETVVALVHALGNGLPLSEVAGIAYRDENDGCVRTEARSRMRDLDKVPWPAWDLLPMKAYMEQGITFGVERGTISLPLLATRGCPYRCTFCSSPQMWGTRYFMRSPKDMTDEIATYIDRYGIRNFDFHDLTAIIKKEWIMDFTHELIHRKLNITWQIPGGTRSEVIDREVANRLYASGCRNITYAPESGSIDMLKAIKKKVSLPAMLDSMRHSAKERMNIKLNIILAFPDERHIHVWQTMFFLVKASWNGAHDMSPGFFSPYPGSELFDRLMKEGKVDPYAEGYFKEMVTVDSTMDARIYNDHIGHRALRVYQLLYFAVFYGSNYLFRPWRLVRTVRNILTDNAESRAEMTIIEMMNRRKVTVLEQPPIETPSVAVNV